MHTWEWQEPVFYGFPFRSMVEAVGGEWFADYRGVCVFAQNELARLERERARNKPRRIKIKPNRFK
jgi:hypothetical protein